MENLAIISSLLTLILTLVWDFTSNLMCLRLITLLSALLSSPYSLWHLFKKGKERP